MGLPRLFRGRRRPILVSLFAIGLGQALAAVALTLLVEETFDRAVAQTSPGGDWTGPAVGLAIAALMTAALRALERVQAERVGQDYAHEVRVRLFRHLTRVPPRVLAARRRGGVLLRFLGDLTALRQWLSLGLMRLTVAGVVTLASLAALLKLNETLGVAVAGTVVVGAVGSALLGRPLDRSVRTLRARRFRLAANVHEKLLAMKAVQAHGRERREVRRMARQSARLRTAAVRRSAVVGALRGVAQATVALATVGAILVGAREVAAGRASPGTVLSAMTLLGLLSPPVRDLGRVHELWQAARVAREKLEALMATPARSGGAKNAAPLAAGPGELVFEDVALEGALEGVNEVVGGGEVVALVGPNGAGKSTLIDLAARLVDPDRGRVLLDGRDLCELRPRDLRRAIGLVGQDLPLVSGTLDRNLRYRWRRAPDEDVARACRLCGLDDLIARLPQGLKTRLREAGSDLSLGERQRIALARALLGTPRLLLLDEADTNLDEAGLEVLQRVLVDYGGTVLVATHRPEIARLATRTWQLEPAPREAAQPGSAPTASNA